MFRTQHCTFQCVYLFRSWKSWCAHKNRKINVELKRERNRNELSTLRKHCATQAKSEKKYVLRRICLVFIYFCEKKSAQTKNGNRVNEFVSKRVRVRSCKTEQIFFFRKNIMKNRMTVQGIHCNILRIYRYYCSYNGIYIYILIQYTAALCARVRYFVSLSKV